MTVDKTMEKAAKEVFVIDDNIEIRQMLTELLNFQGYKAKPFENVDQAVEAARKSKPDVVLLDYRLANRAETSAPKRLDTAQPGINIVLMSAYRKENIDQKALESTKEFLKKPFMPPKLFEVVGRYAKNRQKPYK